MILFRILIFIILFFSDYDYVVIQRKLNKFNILLINASLLSLHRNYKQFIIRSDHETHQQCTNPQSE